MNVLPIAFVFASSILGVNDLAPGVTLLAGRFVPGGQPDGNTVVFDGRDGLIVIDTGRLVEHTKNIVALAREKEQRVTAIVNTHWHLDHIGGNRILRKEFPGVRIHATAAFQDARKGFLANYRRQLVEMIDKSKNAEEQQTWRTEVALIDSGDVLAPDEVVAAPGRRTIAGRDFDVHVESGATAGDIWLLDRKTRTLVAGDLVTLPAPFLDTASPAGWKTALDHIAATEFAMLVPGHGKPMTRAQFETYRSGFNELLACAASTRTKDECVAGWTTAVASLLADDDPKFVRGMMSYYVDVLRRK
jgi:glyoxylase-like metal-dependent hydrolase (beta-lactamase superfamily II)